MGGAGEGAPLPGDPRYGIWSPAGGWFPDPKHWRRNTAFAFLAAAAIGIPIFMMSARLEVHHRYPERRIPSQRWCKNFPPAPERPDPKDLTEELGEPI